MQEEPQVIFNKIPAKQGHIGLITLNRPQKLNALSGEMILALSDKLHAWADDPAINMVIITGAGDRAFCAGGDLKVVYDYGPNAYLDGIHFYETEYKLNLLIHDFPKPYIALLNGIAMGGGLGISIHSARVIGSEKLQLAMPETGIGFFPDVGAGYFFNRCPHKIGIYLGLTGNSIGVADAIYANLVHAYVPSKNLDQLVLELANYDLTVSPLDAFDKVLAKFKQEPGASTLQANASVIEECFSKKSVEEIITALQNNGSKWAKQQLAILNLRSPTSLKVAFRVLSMEATMDLATALDMEYTLTLRLLQQHDIYEGIRAAIIDKTHDPKWQPATLQDVKDHTIDQLFEMKCKT